ncbi:MAG: hypothetical protein D3923_10310 [Candidatus Electrothrix sp. AR3]|nr:hypothetical protein [Candidatus Electrothrix sp. AR3]
METYLLTVDAISAEGLLRKNIFALKVPASHPVPGADDLIQIPEEVAAREGLPIVLQVVSRRFMLDHVILDELSPDCNTCITLLTHPPS